MTIGERIQARRNQLNLSVDDLALAIGKNRATIYRYERNEIEKLPVTVLEPLAEALKVSPAYLLGIDDPPFDANVELIEIPESVLIPVYGKIAAGVPIEAIEDIQEYIDIPAEWVKTGNKFIGLTVEGDSMYPKLWEGDIVVIEVTPDANSGDICAVYVNGYEATLKTIKLSGENITLSPFNTVYPPKTYKREEIGILGVVRELRRKM